MEEKDRKYRQPGYQDYGDERPERGKRKPPPQKEGGPRWKQVQATGPRAPQMPGTREVSRCAECGTILPVLAEAAGSAGGPLGQCLKCGFELHSCKQCTHFDPASRYECTQPIPERIPNKTALNQCTFFELRVMVEKDTTPDKLRPEDARRAFDNLFKK